MVLMRRKIARGGIHGLIFLLLAYTVVYTQGYGGNSFIAVMYIIILATTWMEVKDEIELPDSSFLERIVIVSEGEDLKMRKVFTGEKYRLKGNIQKID